MKRLVFVVLIGLFALNVQAQKNVFNKGDVLFNVGIGAPVGYGYIPTINFSGEVGVIPTGDIGIVSFGGLAELQFANYSYSWNGSYNKVHPIFLFGPRASWHLQVFESNKWDVYAGAGFGIEFDGSYNNTGDYSPDVSPYGEGFVGGRMMFSESFGLFAEVGGGSRSFLKFGITFGIGGSSE